VFFTHLKNHHQQHLYSELTLPLSLTLSLFLFSFSLSIYTRIAFSLLPQGLLVGFSDREEET